MKQVLIFFYDIEINTGSTGSISRLLGSMIHELENTYDITYFTFINGYIDSQITTPPSIIEITFLDRLYQKISNFFAGKKLIKEFHLRKKNARRFVRNCTKNFDVIIVLGLDEVDFLRTNFQDAKIIYWNHNISALCKPQYLRSINQADYFVTPSRNAYHLLLQKLQPSPLLAEYFFMPNWCEDIFLQPQNKKADDLRLRYKIPANAIVFIFVGGNHPVKGKKILDKLINKLNAWNGQHLVFIVAGIKESFSKREYGNVTTLDVGLLSPDELAGHYYLADIGLFPSVGYDHTPLTLIEMAVTNVLPLASDIGGVKEILGSDYPFLVSEPHNSDKWYQKILEVLQSDIKNINLITDRLNKTVRSVYNRNSALETIKTIINQ